MTKKDDYDSNRDYSHLDEEDKEKGEDRETRRAIDRQNRAERTRRRGEEIRAIRRIVELAKTYDPRLLAVDKAAREAKAAKRQARLDAIQEKRNAEAEKARIEAEEQEAARAQSEERRRVDAERSRKQREQDKLESKRERQRLRTFIVTRHDHFAALCSNPTEAGSERVQALAAMDLLCQRLSSVKLQELNDQLHQIESAEEARSLFKSKYELIQKEMQAPGPEINLKPTQSTAVDSQTACAVKYGPEFVRVFVKAVNLLPAGTPKRWDAVASYVNQHVPNVSITAKDALKQAKKLSQDDANLRKEANTKAFDSFSSATRETDALKNVTATSQLEADGTRPWGMNEQRALEQALRSCPAGGTDGGDRWQRIADIVATRTRRECMLRCKQLSDQVRAKKAAMAAVKSPNTATTQPPSIVNGHSLPR